MFPFRIFKTAKWLGWLPTLTSLGLAMALAGALGCGAGSTGTPAPVVTAPSITQQPAAVTLTVGQAATFSVTAQGTSPLSCQWYRNGNLLAGATATAFTETATLAENGAVFTVTVTNSAGTAASAPATLTVKDLPPANLVYPVSAPALKVGLAMTPDTPACGGGAVVAYSVSPALPAGLSLDSATGTLSGTPTAPAGSAAYTVTATNSGGSAQATLTLAVLPAAPASLGYAQNPATYQVGTAITANVPASSGGAATSFTVTPALPAGLLLNGATGVLTGTPTAASPATVYTVTASNAGGSAQAALTLTVLPAAPAGLSFPVNPLVATKGAPIAADTPILAAGSATAFTIAPALPAGLSFNPATGAVTGTPTALAPRATYTVTASNAGGGTQAALDLTVNDAVPSITYGSASYAFTVGLAITQATPVNTGGPALSWTIAPALPAGLAFSGADGTVSGTPTAASPATSYTVTAVNSGGSGTATFTLTVAAPAGPAITSQPSNQTVAAGSTALFSVTATGAAPLTYQWSKNGTAITGATGSSYTTPATTLADNGAVFKVAVTNAVSTVTSSNATLTVTATGPAISIQPMAQTVVAGQMASFAVTATGSGLTYQWARNGTPIAGATSSTYQTPAVATADSGTAFTVVVTSGATSTTSSAANLTVLAPLGGAPTYTLLAEPDNGLTQVYALINGAQKTIDMTMYEFNSDATALNALLAAAAKGVRVRVMLDTNGEKNNNQTVFNALAAGNVSVHWANPIYTYTHQKTMTVDGATTVIFTLNLTGRYYSTSRDYAVIQNDPYDIAAILTTFEADFNSVAITPPTGTNLVWSPTNARAGIQAVIDGAKKTLLIEEEEMADSGLQSALLSALNRGVAVTMVVENESNSYTTALTALKAAGAKIAVYTSSTGYYIHAKVVLADYGTATAVLQLGSENFSSNSLNNNRELGLVFQDPGCMAGVQSAATADFNGGTTF